MSGNRSADFQSTYEPLARDIAGATGMDASVILGQIAQETGYGQHVKGNNIFGISPGGSVASYPSVQEASNAYVNLINKHYPNVAKTAPEGQAQALVDGGYNHADPNYARSVAGLASTFRPAQAAAPQAAPDEGFAARWGLQPANGNAAPAEAAPDHAPDPEFANRWGLKAPDAAPAAAPIPTQTITAPAPVAATPPAATAPATAAAPAADPYAEWDKPEPLPAAAPAAPAGNPLLTYSGLTHALEPAPNTTYGSVVPFARDNTTGAVRPALPSMLRDLVQGGLDLAQGPTTGTMTPAATNALSMIAPGLMVSPAAGTGAAIAAARGVTGAAPTSIFDRSAVSTLGAVKDVAEQNQLQAAAPLPAAFKADPGVLAPQTVTAAAPAEANPLAAAATARATNPLSNNAATPKPTAPATGLGAAAAQEAKEYAAIPEALPPSPKIPPLTQGMADTRADQIIKHFSTHGGDSAGPQDLVPGFEPTLAQSLNDPGLATLERGVASANPGVMDVRKGAQDASMKDYLDSTTGDKDSVSGMQATRSATTDPMRDAAFANKAPTDASGVDDQITKILASPDGKRDAVTKTLTNVQNSLRDADGNLETNPEMLYGVRKHINDLLDPVAQRDKPELQQASRQLIAVKNSLDDAIEAGAPGFKNYVAEYAKQSQPIDEQRYLQGLNLTNQDGGINSAAVDRAIKSINKQQGQPGVQKASAVSDDTMDRLNRLQRTLQVQRVSQTGGKALGSNTFQNLATNSAVGAIAGNPLVHMALTGAGVLTHGLAGMVAGEAARMGVNKVAHNAEAMTRSAITERLLNLQGKGQSVFGAKPAPNPLGSATP